MSGKISSVFLVLLIILSISNTSADSAFTNDVDIQENSVNLVINESYTGIDAESFRIGLDTDENGEVNDSEVATFIKVFSQNRSMQYLGYIQVDNAEVDMQIKSFNLEMFGAQGSVNGSEIRVKANIQFDMSQTISSGTHNVWIIGHPLIERMTIVLPRGSQLKSVDGLDDFSNKRVNGSTVLEGRSGIRSFVVEGKQTYEYAVMIEMYKSPYVADLSIFPSLF